MEEHRKVYLVPWMVRVQVLSYTFWVSVSDSMLRVRHIMFWSLSNIISVCIYIIYSLGLGKNHGALFLSGILNRAPWTYWDLNHFVWIWLCLATMLGRISQITFPSINGQSQSNDSNKKQSTTFQRKKGALGIDPDRIHGTGIFYLHP